jgi:putative ABC transport system permease protein
MRKIRWHERLFRAMLRLFPSEFRADFGESMAEDFRDQHADAAATRGRAVAHLWMRTMADLLRRAPAEHLDVIGRDVSYAARLLARRPGFAAITVATLAIGIGLNSAVFSLTNAILLRPLPIPDSRRLVRLFDVEPAPSREVGDVSAPDFIDWRARARSLDGVALIGGTLSTFSGDGDPEQVRAMTVTEDFFRLLGATPALGRLFTAADFEPLKARFARDAAAAARVVGGQVVLLAGSDAPGVVVLGHDLWTRRYAARRDIVGRMVTMGGRRVEVIGVLPPEFTFRDIPGWGTAECWMPAAADPRSRDARYLSAIGRLAPGVTRAAAQAELDVIARQLAAAHPESNQDRGVRLVPLVEAQTRSVRTQLWLLFGAAACVLLIACANLANLLLAHASGRRRELATRVALGATRGRLVRQTMTESVVIALAGGVAGAMIAAWALPTLVALAPHGVPRLAEVRTDRWMFAFAACASIAVGCVCGLASALSIDRASPHPGELRTAGYAGGHHGQRLRRVLIVAELSLALMLVVASGLLVRTLRALEAQELGFDPHHVVSIGLAPDIRKYRQLGTLARQQYDFVARLRSVPDVVAAGVGSRPLGGSGISTLARGREGSAHRVSVDVVSDGFLEALGIPLVAGRFVAATDVAGAPRVCLVNVAAARLLTGKADPVGETLAIGEKEAQIVGVVADTRRGELETAPEAAVYLSLLQPSPFSINNVLVRTRGNPRDVLPIARAALRQLDADQPLTRVTTLDERLDEMLAPRRFLLRLIGSFSAIALALAMIGVYGVISEAVARRVPEIGVRMALGAAPADIRRQFVAEGTRLAALGTIAGVIGALGLRHSMATVVFGVATADAATYAGACVCLIAAAAAACAIPAARAAALDPVSALRRN